MEPIELDEKKVEVLQSVLERSKYFNPDAPPEEVLQAKYRKMMIRFRTKEDMIEFMEKLGITLNTSKPIINYGSNQNIDSFF